VDAKILNNLTDMSKMNYRMSNCQNMIADIKADTTIDSAASTELLSFADKVMAADIKINQDAIAMVAKYSVSENIDPAEPDNDEDDYY
jgi:hypothetical protein